MPLLLACYLFHTNCVNVYSQTCCAYVTQCFALNKVRQQQTWCIVLK